MTDLLDDSFQRFEEPAEVYPSLGFKLVKENKFRAPYGTWNIYQAYSIYVKTDPNGNSWSFNSKDKCTESGKRIMYEVTVEMLSSVELHP